MKMYAVQAQRCTRLFLIMLSVMPWLDFTNATEAEILSTIEPEASIGCPIPDLRFSRPKKFGTTTTEQPFVTFETTQIYLPEDFTTADLEYIENGGGGSDTDSLETGENVQRQTRYTDFNPYAWGGDDESATAKSLDEHEEEIMYTSHQQHTKHERRKLRKNSSGRRRFERPYLQHQHKQAKREVNIHSYPSSLISSSQLPLIHQNVYYVESTAIKSSLHSEQDQENELIVDRCNDTDATMNYHTNTNAMNIRKHTVVNNEIDDLPSGPQRSPATPGSPHQASRSNAMHAMIRSHDDIDTDTDRAARRRHYDESNALGDTGDGEEIHATSVEVVGTTRNSSSTDKLRRVKRKSGKTTGALSRPKGASDSGSKSTSRKKDGGGYDEEGLYIPHSPDESESESGEEEEEVESAEHEHFGEVTEVRFPGEVGPLGDRRLCKIRCVKGKWVGPLCATNEEDDHGQTKFQPLYKSCHVNRIPPHLLLSYRNISVNVGWDLPHGHSLQARCKDLGLYKLLGETRVLCSNGLWAPRMPSCVPTTLLTNYSDDSPPSIRIKIGIGSGAFEPSGVLAVLPTSTIHLDCMYPRRRGTPEWTWTGWFRQYYTGWSNVPEEKATKYRLTIKDIQLQDSGTYTCASPRGLTNSIVIVVATSTCPQHPDAVPPLTLRLEGLKLGHRALYTCPLGYTIDGTSNSTCLASGNWSSPPPSCHPVQCPPLFLEDPHLSLTELNTSAWGRAVFKCSWGYRLSGPPGLECEPSGVWSGPVPRCRAVQCPQPLVPINGRIDGTSGSASHRRYAVGALVTFSCTEGHLLVGEASIVCTETGFWSHPPPFCKSQCPYPGDPPNGLIAPLKFHYDPGDFLSVQCRPGFVEYGTNGPPDRPRCLPDGNWSGPVPQCRNYEEV